ncbi:MAG: hypothetical protein MAG451_03141 [Anaerolineales bacterium]|nr:hypothetical protein [Anaerolineales bacterium]
MGDMAWAFLLFHVIPQALCVPTRCGRSPDRPQRYRGHSDIEATAISRPQWCRGHSGVEATVVSRNESVRTPQLVAG